MDFYAMLAHLFAWFAMLSYVLALAVGGCVALALRIVYRRRDLRARRLDPLARARAIRGGRR